MMFSFFEVLSLYLLKVKLQVSANSVYIKERKSCWNKDSLELRKQLAVICLFCNFVEKLHV